VHLLARRRRLRLHSADLVARLGPLPEARAERWASGLSV
jgi:hypothetical protein